MVPDDKKTVDPNPPVDTRKSKGLGFFGWFFIVLFLGVVVLGAWYLVRREQLKNQAREKMIEDTPELEGYD